MDWLAKLADVLRSPKLVGCAAISSLLLISIPDFWLPGGYIDDFRDRFGLFIILVLIISFSMLLIEAISWMWAKKKEQTIYADKKLRILERLWNLDHNEMVILREFFLQDRNVIQLPPLNPTVIGLLHDGIINIVANSARHVHLVGRTCTVRMSNEADALIELEMVGLYGDEPTEEDQERISRERPSFIRSILDTERIWDK